MSVEIPFAMIADLCTLAGVPWNRLMRAEILPMSVRFHVIAHNAEGRPFINGGNGGKDIGTTVIEVAVKYPPSDEMPTPLERIVGSEHRVCVECAFGILDGQPWVQGAFGPVHSLCDETAVM